jgi:hypothetical protein
MVPMEVQAAEVLEYQVQVMVLEVLVMYQMLLPIKVMMGVMEIIHTALHMQQAEAEALELRVQTLQELMLETVEQELLLQ